jgi:ABC-type transport system substrate-binding protein
VLCAISCHQTIRSVFDPLTLPTPDGTIEPYLAESIEPNADYTVWTLTAREGVTFHDGTPFDGAAIADNLTRHTKSFLTAAALTDIAENPDGTPQIVVTDPMTVEITMTRPWVPFPIYLAGQIGYMASPTWLAAADADVSLEPKAVGTGPFVFKDYKPGESFTATKNPTYWNQPYPFLDEYETRVIPDALTRASALEAGDVDIIQTTNGETIAKYRDDPENFPMTESTAFAETGYTLLHVTQEGSPLQDARVRCAMANATDQQAIIDQIGAGVQPIANGPFSEGQLGNLEDSGFPLAQDMAKAQELVADYKAENPGPLNINLSTTQDATNLIIAQAQQQFFTEAGFDDVQISQIEQAKYILTALQGDFQAFQWRNHGGVDLDAQYIWWHSSNALPVGQLALNFGRIKDDVIDEALDGNRGETDPAAKQEYAETVNRRFGEQCYNLWGSYTVWGLAHHPRVHGIDDMVLPSGNPAALGAGIAGSFNVASVWVEQ